MVAAVPERVTKEYLKAHWIKRAWVEVIEQLIAPTIAWSVAESAAIAEGSDDPGSAGAGRPAWEGARYDPDLL